MSRKTKDKNKSKNKKIAEPGLPEEEKLHYADMTDRLFASMLDLAIVYIFVSTISEYLFGIFYPGGSEYVRMHTMVVQQYPDLASEPTKIMMYISTKYPQSMDLIINQMCFNAAIQAVLVGFYFIPMTKIYGATLGKKLIGLKVIDGITGKGLSWSQSVIRYIGYMPSVFIFGLGIIAGMIGSKKRCWHDTIADTYVILNRERWYKRYIDKLKNYFHLK